MSHSRKNTRVADISDAEYTQRKAELEKEKDRIAEETQKLISQGEDIHSLERKASELGKGTNVFKRQTPAQPKKSFFARFFGCLPCCGSQDDADEKKPLLGNRR